MVQVDKPMFQSPGEKLATVRGLSPNVSLAKAESYARLELSESFFQKNRMP
jgi:hypothetical protein